MVLRRHEKQPWTGFHRPWLRGTATSLQDPKDCRISCEHANSNGEHYRDAENQRHEERNHSQTHPLLQYSDAGSSTFVYSGFFNLPAFTPAASDDPDAPLGAPR